MPVTIKKSALRIDAKVRGGKLLIDTEAGFLPPEQAGVIIDETPDASGGTGTGGAITLADGADATTGAKTDPIATDLANATMMSVLKANTAATLELIKALGAKSGGASVATSSLLTGGVYTGSQVARAVGDQGGLLTDLRGNLRVRLHGTNVASADGTQNIVAGINGENDGFGSMRPLATALYGLDDGSGTFNRVRMNKDKGLFVSQTAPDTASGSTTAQSITGSTVATASLVGVVANPGLKYKKATVHVKNLGTVAFSDLVLKTKCNPADPTYDQTLAGGQWLLENPYVLEVTSDPTVLVNAEVRIVLDISLFSGFEIRAAAQAPGTTASLRYFLAEGV